MFIGISGYARSGKSTVARYITDNYNTLDKNGIVYPYIELSFASILKDMLCVLLQVTREELELLKENNTLVLNSKVSVRYLMQTLGTEWGRNLVNQNIWVHAMRAYIDKHSIVNAVFSDVRFLNEVNFIKELKGVLFFVKRGNEQYLQEEENKHASEQFVSLIEKQANFILENNGSLQDLRDQCHAALIRSFTVQDSLAHSLFLRR